MPRPAPNGPAAEGADLHDLLSRVIRARVDNAEERRDIVQEAIARTLEVRPRLAPEVVPAYAVTVARNLAAAQHRSRSIARRHQARLYDPGAARSPEDDLVQAEMRSAVRAAVVALPETERTVLLGHVNEGSDTTTLAEAVGSTPGGVAARLARARARARVDYVLALRRQELPTDRCRQILFAISAADTRRQRALQAAEHLLDCPVCPDLIRPLAERNSVLAGLLPVPLLAAIARLRVHTTPALIAGSTAVVAAAGYLAATQTHAPSPPLAAPPLPAAPLAAVPSPHASAPVVQISTSAGPQPTIGTVTEVSAPYGFWLAAAGTKTYVVFHGLPEHRVRLGERISVTGSRKRLTPALLANPKYVGPDPLRWTRV